MNRADRRAARYGRNQPKPARSRVQRGHAKPAPVKCDGVRRWLKGAS